MSQEYKSMLTSINSTKVPSLFKRIEWNLMPSVKRNLDIGGGRYDTATKYLEQFGIKNLIFDPYNRSLEENLRIVMDVGYDRADTATISNVLNVIKERDRRIEVLKKAKRWAKIVYISVYEGNRSGIGKQFKSNAWQENRVLSDYLSEVQEVFPNVRIQKKMIMAWT